MAVLLRKLNSHTLETKTLLCNFVCLKCANTVVPLLTCMLDVAKIVFFLALRKETTDEE